MFTFVDTSVGFAHIRFRPKQTVHPRVAPNKPLASINLLWLTRTLVLRPVQQLAVDAAVVSDVAPAAILKPCRPGTAIRASTPADNCGHWHSVTAVEHLGVLTDRGLEAVCDGRVVIRQLHCADEQRQVARLHLELAGGAPPQYRERRRHADPDLETSA